MSDTLLFHFFLSTYESVESLIIKEQNTVVKLALKSAKTGNEYDIQALRHVPIRTWTSIR